MPAGQVKQAVAESAANVPAPQAAQLVRPAFGAMVPAAHAAHAEAPVSDWKAPLAHVAQLEAELDAWYRPPAQLEHAVDEARAYVPLVQAMLAVLAVGQ